MIDTYKLKVILITSILLFLLNSNANLNVHSNVQFEEYVSSSFSSNYNTTSPIEYFNETKHQRYNLVARPIDLIISPNKGRPIITDFDGNFTVTINSSSLLDDWTLSLVNTENTIELEILDNYNNNDGCVLTVQPSLNVEGLYDLQFNSSIGDDYQTHSVKIIQKKEYPFTFIHISDSHFPCYGQLNTTDICLNKIEEIKDLDVDFAIFTGDLIEGGPSWLFVDPVTKKPLAAEIQLKLGLWALDLLDMPVYIIAGNSRIIWEKYLGENNIISFEFLDWLYVGYSATKEGISSSEYNTVKEVLGSAHQNNIPSILFYHSNFMNQASNLRKLYSIEVMLYGHEHHEELYLKGYTLYHCVDAMFNNGSSIFTVLNATSIILDDIKYDFSMLLQETVQTSFSSFFILVLTPVCMLFLTQKRKKKLS
jgi:predicted MPP superfamily phosphohydrolase